MSLPVNTLPPPTADQAALALENVRLKAAVGLEELLYKVTTRGGEDGATFKMLMEAAEFNYKLSGMAAKQAAAAAPQGLRISFNFNSDKTGRTIEAVATRVEEVDVLENPPAHIERMPMTFDLVGFEDDE